MQEVIAQYSLPVSGYASPLEGGGYVLKTSMGMAVLYAPFFFIAHVLAPVWGYPADGFSLPYQYAIAIGCVVYAWIGLWVMRRVLLRYFSDWVVAVVLVMVVLGTNYLHYTALKGAMAHGPLFALYAFLLWGTVNWHDRPRKQTAWWTGIVLGMIVLVRPTDMVAGLIPLLWGVKHMRGLRAKLGMLWDHWQHVGLLILGVCLVGIWQMVYWKIYSGKWIYYSYQDVGFNFLDPHLWDGLMSWQKGWLIYTPIMVFALLGFIPMFKRYRIFFWAIIVYFAVHYYIVFSWEDWDYGGGLGARPLVQAYAPLMLPLCAAIAGIRKRYWHSLMALILVVMMIDFNLMLHWQSHAQGGGMVTEQMNRAYYLKLLGSTQIKPDDKKLLDAPRYIRSMRGKDSRVLYLNDFEARKDSLIIYSHKHGRWSAVLDENHPALPRVEIPVSQFSPKPGSWIRMHADCFFEVPVWHFWNQARLYGGFMRGEQYLVRRGVRLHWLTESWRWYPLSYDIRIPKNIAPDDRLVVWFALSPGNPPVWVDNLKVELVERE